MYGEAKNCGQFDNCLLKFVRASSPKLGSVSLAVFTTTTLDVERIILCYYAFLTGPHPPAHFWPGYVLVAMHLAETIYKRVLKRNLLTFRLTTVLVHLSTVRLYCSAFVLRAPLKTYSARFICHLLSVSVSCSGTATQFARVPH